MSDQQDNGGERRQVLEDACARNASLELHHRPDDGDVVVARARLLGIDDRFIYLDRPETAGVPVTFAQKRKLDGYLLLNDLRYAFRTTVVDLRCMVKLNDEKRVVGMVLRRPKELKEGQRRSHFRVSLFGDEPIPVELHEATADEDGTCPIRARRLPATLGNLSVGGAGVNVATFDVREVRVDEKFFLTFQLPGEEEPFTFLTEVRQVWALGHGEVTRVGLKNRQWPTPRAVRRMQERLNKYITDLQRNRLRRTG